jgi:hypothetical protein
MGLQQCNSFSLAISWNLKLSINQELSVTGIGWKRAWNYTTIVPLLCTEENFCFPAVRTNRPCILRGKKVQGLVVT